MQVHGEAAGEAYALLVAAVHQALRHVLEEVYGLQVHGEAAGEAYALLVAVEAVETDGDLWEEVDSNPQREGHTL